MVGREEEISNIVCFTFLGNATRAIDCCERACRMMTREVLSGVGVPRMGMYETRSPVVVVHLECLD
jgi:hypothetical protein